MVPTFLKSISLEVNIIAQLEFELAYYESTVQHFNYYAIGTIPLSCDSMGGITYQNLNKIYKAIQYPYLWLVDTISLVIVWCTCSVKSIFLFICFLSIECISGNPIVIKSN